MKFRAHETFFIRKGWLSKGMKYVKNTDGEVFIDKDKNPMDVLGIGSNMVKALRYWLMATGLTEEKLKTENGKAKNGRKFQFFTELGKLVFENDTYLEEFGTLQLLHYKLAANMENATSWYFFFNEFNLSEFTEEDFIVDIQKFIALNTGDGEKQSGTLRTLGDDFSCILGTYIPRKNAAEKFSPENNIACPFSELGLVSVLDEGGKLYKKSIPQVSSFNPYVILSVIADTADSEREVKLNDLLYGKNSIGRIFNLDSISMIEILRNAEKTGEIKIIRTAGMDVIQRENPERNFLDYVKKFYESLKEEK